MELHKSLEDLMDQSPHIKKVVENFTSKQIANKSYMGLIPLIK